jgi:hypothetical protein
MAVAAPAGAWTKDDNSYSQLALEIISPVFTQRLFQNQVICGREIAHLNMTEISTAHHDQSGQVL